MDQQSSKPHGPAFLDELADTAVLDAAVLRERIVGSDNIRRVVAAVGGIFLSQTPGFRVQEGNLEIYEYKAALADDQHVNGVITVTRAPDGAVMHVGSYMTPLGSLQAVAAALREKLPDVDESLFI